MEFSGEASADAALECFRALANAVDEGVFQLDVDGRFVAVNDVIVEITGYSREDLLDEHISIVVDDADVGRIEREIRRHQEAEESSVAPLKVTAETAASELRPLEVQITTVRDGDESSGALGIVRDVTERERELERYETIVETVNDGVYMVDAEERFTRVNDAYTGMTGYSREELIGEHVSLVVDAETIEETRSLEQKMVSGEVDRGTLEAEIMTADGNTVPAEATFALLPSDDGEYERVGIVRDITERKRAEQNLRESEERFRTMMEESPFSIQVFDADGRTLAANPAWERLWDASRDELADYNILQDEQLKDAGVLSYVRDAFAGEVVALPVTHYDPAEIGKPGRDRWIEGYAYPLLPGEGESYEVALVHHDITDRMEREQELERYERAVETVWDGITILDSDDRFVLVNEAFCELTGYDREEVIGEHATIILDETTYEQAGELHDGVVEGSHTTATLEYDLLTADGGTVPVEAKFGPVEYADGTVGGAGVIRDISDRRKRERELERALDLLEKAEHIAAVGGWEIDADTMEVFWTDHLFELLEVPYEEEPPLEEALGVYHEDDRRIVENAIEEALDSGDPFDVEARFRTGSGEVGWLRIQGAPETVDDQVVSLRGAVQDVTESIQREQRLEELIDRLEESNRRLEQFAYAASHDLQEPLRMVTSYLQLIEQRYSDALDEDGEEFLEFAVDGADRMREMIQGLLQYSRVDVRGNPLEPVELDGVLADVCDDLRMKIDESDAEITAEALPRVEGDASQLRQLFQNLLRNAIEYSGDEPPRIDISTERDGEHWLVSVRDEGIGIDPEDTDRIFEVFQRLHTNEKHPGTGIGLPLCQRIVERHGGEIRVESEPGAGSTFTFTLPVVRTSGK